MIALSFDTDWMQPDDLRRFLDEYPFPGSGTFFLHRPYALELLGRHELCPHPMPGAPDLWKATIGRMLQDLRLTPTGIRTHSAYHSHFLEVCLSELGFKYTSNTSRLFLDGTVPVRLAWGCWELPIYYMDNLDLTMVKHWRHLGHQPFSRAALLQALAGDGLYVFDFHPLHVCLNTPTLEYYLQHQARLKAGASPFDLAFRGRGAGTYFRELCDMMVDRQVGSTTLLHALEHFVPDVEVPAGVAA